MLWRMKILDLEHEKHMIVQGSLSMPMKAYSNWELDAERELVETARAHKATTKVQPVIF